MRRGRLLPTALLAGYAFLYVPIALLVATSFNPSRLTTVITGFSITWYVTLWHDAKLIDAARLSLLIAAVSATGATLLGTLAGFALARFGGFRGRGLFASLISARLVLPDVLVGLSMLLLFVQSEQLFGWPADRGVLTITLAHISVSLSYVAVVVEARLTDAGTELEEAAQDLGATPLQAFLRITLPLLGPALLAGWLLAFTLSLDDLVVATFTSGPGASTLPMVVFSAMKLGVTPELNALASLILLLVAVCLGGAWAAQRRFAATRK
ncbi:MAG: ABC transporter permease subunit [Acetobacteraceae bacterium]|nr:ABC transporter permease subunit [Acetobacteraceae bacterium]